MVFYHKGALRFAQRFTKDLLTYLIFFSRSLAHRSRSSAEYCQGAPLFSILLNRVLISPGADASSITRYLRISTISVGWLIFIGHSLAHALHVVQAQSSSSEIKSLKRDRLSLKSHPFLTIRGPFSFILALRSIITFLGDNFFPVIFAGHTDVHLPH